MNTPMQSLAITNEKHDFIVVGGGISGLVLAHQLKAAGRNVLILEKSKSAGGRIATRRFGEATFDHGAQFYKQNVNSFSELDMALKENNIVSTWFEKESYKYQSAPKGMTQIAKFLAKDLPIAFNERIVEVSVLSQTEVRLVSETGSCFFASNVCLTCPLPQALSLLQQSNIAFQADLEKINYAKALVGLFEVHFDCKQAHELVYFESVSEEIFSISNQISKSVSVTPAITVVMTPKWSETYFDSPDGAIAEQIELCLKKFFASNSLEIRISSSQLKKWRYSHPIEKHQQNFVQIEGFTNLFLCGDAFGGGSIMGAVHSAAELSRKLDMNTLQTFDHLQIDRFKANNK